MSERTRIARKKEAAPVQSNLLQRRSDTAQSDRDEVPPIVQEVLSSSGQPLDTATREFMEPRFGHDFSQVRVHTDERATESAGAVNALAYTVGRDVVFGEGQYEPETSEGQRLLAHELTHVVQQESELLSQRPMFTSNFTSTPSDILELNANEVASRVMADNHSTNQGIQPTIFVIPIQQDSSHIYIQRFQPPGHELIEEQALTKSGFSSDEVDKVYFGNWLRDFSQVPSFLFDPVNTIALGLFGREISKDDLGTYIPSEHLDNPQGSSTIEDPLLSSEKSEKASKDLLSNQQAAYKDEHEHISKIQKESEKSGLPEYIERGKFHVKRELTDAINLGRSPDGMQAMGNGLHAVEDYFSHSNFVEVAIDILRRENISEDLASKVSSMDGIVTGTFGTSGDKITSFVEQFKTEIKQGRLKKYYVIGKLKELGTTPEDIEKRFGIKIKTIEDAIALVGLGAIINAYPGIAAAMAGILALVTSGLVEKATTWMSAEEAKIKRFTGPTHSQLSKDAPDHPLYSIAIALAEYVDQDIGSAMIDAWQETEEKNKQAHSSLAASPEVINSVTGLVDKYISHPARNLWWINIVPAHIKSGSS